MANDANSSKTIVQSTPERRGSKAKNLNILQKRFGGWFERRNWDDARRVKFRNFVESKPVTIFMNVITIYALFADDFRLFFFNPSHDPLFGYIAFVVLLAFLAELLIMSYAIEDYFLSFFFFLDLVACISLVFDVEFIMKNTGLGGGGANEARAGRAARAGTKASRIVRLVRLIRLTQLIKYLQRKLLKFIRSRSKKKVLNIDEINEEYDHYADNKKYQPTKIGAFLATMMTKKVIIAVLSMIFILPYLQAMNTDDLTEIYPSIQQVHNLYTVYNTTAMQKYLVGYFAAELYSDEDSDKWVIYFRINNTVFIDREEIINNRRTSEVETFFIDGYGENAATLVVFDIKNITKNDSLKSMLNTAFLIFMLAALAMVFTNDTEKYVVQPIRDMTNAIRNLASYDKAMKMTQKINRKQILKNIIELRKQANFNKLIKDRQMSNSNINSSSRGFSETGSFVSASANMSRSVNRSISETSVSMPSRKKKAKADSVNANDSKLETDIMHGTIKKLARLLELGFGVAGQDIVRKIISDSDKNNAGSNNEIDFTKTEGSKIDGIFGFCIINDFAPTLQVLQGDIMVYVNSIAKIVHTIVHEYSGAANKNIGNAFLCVWKLPDQVYSYKSQSRNSRAITYDEFGNEKRIRTKKDLRKARQNLADQALLAYLKIIISIRENEEIQRYSQIPELKKLLPKDWKVSLGFGLHVGWGIEGAIGSRHKIDASYLSPNVNLAARLESGTHQFGVDILLSDEFVALMSPTARKYCRQIDCVKVKGSGVPMGLWTYDLLDVDDGMSSKTKNRRVMPTQSLTIISENFDISEAFEALQMQAEAEQKEEDEEEEIKSNTNAGPFYDDSDVLKIKTRISHIILAIQNEKENITQWERVFMEDIDLLRYRQHIDNDFYGVFKDAFLHYIEGDWKIARDELEKCLAFVPSDGPSNVLLNVLKSYNYEAPVDWGGHRSLTAK